VTRRSVGVILVAITLAGCGGKARNGVDPLRDVVVTPVGATKPLHMRTLTGSVVRMGSLRGEPLYGVRLRAFVCSRSRPEANRTYPTSFRIAHYVTPGRTPAAWGKPFRVLDNDLYWLVSLGETRVCRNVEFDDIIPPENYGGLESPLGALGYSRTHRCYGVRLTLRAALGTANQAKSKSISASKRVIIQCGRFRRS
jgi:hypothetical protein